MWKSLRFLLAVFQYNFDGGENKGSTVVTLLSGDSSLIREVGRENLYLLWLCCVWRAANSALGIVLKLSLLHTKWLLLHFISSYFKYAFEQGCTVILEWDSCFSYSPSAPAFVLLEQTVDVRLNWLGFSYARKHFNHKAPVICHHHLKQLYGLSFQDVGNLFGGEQEPNFDVA